MATRSLSPSSMLPVTSSHQMPCPMIISSAPVGKGENVSFQFSSAAEEPVQVRLNHLVFFKPTEVILGVSQLDEDLTGVLTEERGMAVYGALGP